MANDLQSAEARTALALLRASGRVIVDATIPHADLVVLAQAAAQWGAALTIRQARLHPTEQLLIIAAAGRGHVTFDLAS
jgi:hypothetical protein